METRLVNRNVLYSIDASNQVGVDGWHVIWQSQIGVQSPSVQLGEYSAFLHTLQATVFIDVLEEIPLNPEMFAVELDEAERVNLARQYQLNSPRVNLQIGLRKGDNSAWQFHKSVTLLPIKPYIGIDLLEKLTNRVDFLMERDLQIGLKIADAGYGLLQGGSYVNISGSVQEQQYYSEVAGDWTDRWVNSNAELLPNQSTRIVEANNRRKSLSLINSGNEIVFLSIGADAELDKGILLNPKGGSFTLNWGSSTYSQQAIYAISKKASRIAISEGSIQ